MKTDTPTSGTDVLRTPVTIGRTTLENRLAVAPMTRVSAQEDGRATDRMRRYYGSFAAGEFGLVITEGTYTDAQFSQGYLYQPGLVTSQHVEAWAPVVAAVQEQGAKIFAQLMHAGAQSQGNSHRDGSIGPGDVAPRGAQLGFYRGEGPYPAPRAADAADLAVVRRGFGDAASRAHQAGFDGVEIHGANGYLIDEFLTDYMNPRTDGYGGSVERRVRFAVEVVDEVLQRVGSSMTVGIRISQAKVSDALHRWAGGENEAATIFGALGRAGVHFVHTTEPDALAPAFGEGTSSFAALARQHANVPVIVNGQLGAPSAASRAISEGHGDVVALGKSALADRAWPRRVREGVEPEGVLRPDVLAPIADIKEWEAPR